MSYIVLRDRWCNITVQNVHATSEDKSDNSKDRFCKELEQVFDLIPRYHMKNLLGDINHYPTSVKLFFVATVRSSPRDGPLNRWACLTTHLFKSLGVFNDALDNTSL